MEKEKAVWIVIPAYEPDERMINLLKELHQQTCFSILVVNDGSGSAYDSIFHEAEHYGRILTHNENKGKGAALKTAFSYLLKNYPGQYPVITADADGQHSLGDIKGVLHALEKKTGYLILGSRCFTGNVPFKSRVGNKITRTVFHLTSGVQLLDTQTGLRAFMSSNLPYMEKIEGSRYEYEMNVLIFWARDQRPIYELPIETIYIDDNSSSHFHPVRDSIEIYKEILKFSCSSLISFLADYSLYSLFIILTGGLAMDVSLSVSNISARILSASLNYYLNRKFVFKSSENVLTTALQYALLAVSILIMNTLLLTLLVHTIIPNQFAAKILVESILFIFSGLIQKRMIFSKKGDSI